MRRLLVVFCAWILVGPLPGLHAQPSQGERTPIEIEDEQGNVITFEVGEAAFADAVASFEQGDPHSDQGADMGTLALGVPDYTRGNGGSTAITLGCNGVLRLQFTDNVLVDQPGADLHIFEVGPDVEPTFVAVSTDGETWRDIGKVEGGTASLDISTVADSGEVFRFVQLTDDGENCRGNWPGADIDAIGAINANEVVELAGNLLFDVDSRSLRPEAQSALRDIAEQLRERDVDTVTVVGHTDAQGPDDYNQQLSLERARSVRSYLVQTLGVTGIAFDVRGAGSTEPAATNATAEGRRQNRRVEFIF